MISGTSSHDPVDCSRSGVDKEVAATRLAPLSDATTMATLGGVSSLRKSPRSARTTEFNHSSYGCGSPGILSTLCQDLMPQQTWALVVTKTRIYIYQYMYTFNWHSSGGPSLSLTGAPLSLHLNMVRGDFEVKREQLHAPPARALTDGCLRARRPTLATTRAQSAGLVKALVKMSANCFSVSTPVILR